MDRNKTKKRDRLTKQNCGRRAFSRYVDCLLVERSNSVSRWRCCETIFEDKQETYKHVSKEHKRDVEEIKQKLLKEHDDMKDEPKRKRLNLDDDNVNEELTLQTTFSDQDSFAWLPDACQIIDENGKGQILLFYHYRWIENVNHVMSWQKELCRRLRLTGKIRCAHEGLNATVGGTIRDTEVYIQSVLAHPLFNQMTVADFKKSEGSAADFPNGLKVGQYAEICPMGVDPHAIPFTKAGKHVSPEQFHQALEDYKKTSCRKEEDKVFIDCRNFYESKIGAFEKAVRPDIRKFSYWPEYVDKNEELFKDKTVYMYCTGGIRCERGSAYLVNKGICKDVLQLSGGIHKYMDQYPDGNFRGKLFVFDDRYHSHTNTEVISHCTYCKALWDTYLPCTSPHCHQLVLSCTECRAQSLTTCCRSCATNAAKAESSGKRENVDNTSDGKEKTVDNVVRVREECECTKERARVPVENIVTPTT